MNIEEFVFALEEYNGWYNVGLLPIDKILSIAEDWIRVKPVKLKKFILAIDDYNYYYYDGQFMALKEYSANSTTRDHMYLSSSLEPFRITDINHFEKYEFARTGDAFS